MSTEEKSTALEVPTSALSQLEAEGGSLADFDGSEGGTSRIRIKGDDPSGPKWVDSLSGLEVSEFSGIICGVLRQRVLWPPEVGEEASDPLCKSLDAKIARPNPESFPIKESGFDLKVISEGLELDCGACKLKDWDSHPKREGPWCTDQITAVVLADLEGVGTFLPALMTFQRSSMKPAMNYLAGFKRASAHPFASYTRFTLEAKKRGNVRYAVPIFGKAGETPKDEHEVYASNYLAMRDYVTKWRDQAEDGDLTPTVRVSDELPDF